MGRTRLYNGLRAGMIGRYVHSFVDLIFPPQCWICRSSMMDDRGSFCTSCLSELQEEWDEPACPRCAHSVSPFEIAPDKKGRMGCGECRDQNLKIKKMIRVGSYREHMAHLIKSYKYRGREEIGPILGNWLSKIIQQTQWFDCIEGIVSVPTHWKHRVNRPLYAADKLASYVSDRTGWPHLEILKRTRAGPHQMNLSFTERQKNVRGAFAIQKNITMNDARLLLIDDVKTTGATLEECAKVLRKAGAAEIYAAVVVKVDWTGSNQLTQSMI